MTEPLSAALSPSAHTVGGSGRGAATSTVGGALSVLGAAATIPAADLERWLAQLSPAQLRAVLGWACMHLPLAAVPAAYQGRVLDLAPEAAQLNATGQLDAYAEEPPPPLVERPDGSLFYTAGGEQYRQVPDDETAASLGLNVAAAVLGDGPSLSQAPPWPHAATPAAAFTAAGDVVAARGSVGAAYSFAAMWLPRMA